MEARNDVQAFTDSEFLFFNSILGSYGGRFVFDCNRAGADIIAIQKYDKNFGRVLEKTRYSVKGEGVVLQNTLVRRKGRILGSSHVCSNDSYRVLAPLYSTPYILHHQ